MVEPLVAVITCYHIVIICFWQVTVLKFRTESFELLSPSGYSETLYFSLLYLSSGDGLASFVLSINECHFAVLIKLLFVILHVDLMRYTGVTFIDWKCEKTVHFCPAEVQQFV